MDKLKIGKKVNIALVDSWEDDHLTCVLLDWGGREVKIWWLGADTLIEIGQAMEGNVQAQERLAEIWREQREE